ncbi:MAG: glycosyltransferase [Methylacidiphilales bacterium]|nr:glycosyltransferase [Candidatus Methylacidiphilales bacterium]
MNQQVITILASFSGQGGVEKMLVQLCNGLVALHRSVRLLCIKNSSPHLSAIDSRVEIIKLPTTHAYVAIPAIAKFLTTKTPPHILVAKDRAARALWIATKVTQKKLNYWIRVGTTLGASLQYKNKISTLVRTFALPSTYHDATGIIAVSQGVALDIHQRYNIPLKKIHTVPNPVITPELFQLAKINTNHDFFKDPSGPILIAMGRMSPEKDFGTLLQACTLVRNHFPIRLIIIGGGSTTELFRTMHWDVSPDWLSCVGFIQNPYPYLAQASLFVLSSKWEGSPNALTEALALGTQVVSTDCPSGPREVLQGGLVAPLVPVGNPSAMAEAIIGVLKKPQAKNILQDAVKEYTQLQSAKRYLALLEGN